MMRDDSQDSVGNEQSDVFVGGLGGSMHYAKEYCIIEGETSLCDQLYRRLGHPNGAKSATTWDYEVSGAEDAPVGVELCKECAVEGGWGAVSTTGGEQEGKEEQ